MLTWEDADLKKINLRFKREFREWPDVFTVF